MSASWIYDELEYADDSACARGAIPAPPTAKCRDESLVRDKVQGAPRPLHFDARVSDCIHNIFAHLFINLCRVIFWPVLCVVFLL